MRHAWRRAPVPLFALALMLGCAQSTPITAPVVGNQAAFVLTSDFSTGALSVIDVETGAVTPNVALVHSDAAMRLAFGLLYVVNRFGQDNIQVIDPGNGFATVKQFSTGNGSNPQDIVVVSPSKAYVTRYASTDLLVVDPRSGSERDVISLAGFADSDGLPEMAQMTFVDPWLFVCCQRLTNFVPTNSSVIAIIDTRDDQLVDLNLFVPGVQGIELTGRNPLTDLVYDPITRDLLVGCAGAFGVTDGGIERVDVATRRSLGFAIDEATLGGDVVDLAWNGADHSYAVVSDAGFNTSLVAWNATTGAVLDTLVAPGGFTLADCAINDRSELYVSDAQLLAPGVRIFRTIADTLITGPLNTGLPPRQVVFR